MSASSPDSCWPDRVEEDVPPPAFARDWRELEGDRIEAAIHGASREQLEDVVRTAAQTLCTVDSWLGQASTREAAADALWRLHRALRVIRVTVHLTDLEWRGSLIAYLNRAGWRAGEDGTIRRVLPEQRPWEHAAGETLEDFTRRHAEPLDASRTAEDDSATCYGL